MADLSEMLGMLVKKGGTDDKTISAKTAFTLLLRQNQAKSGIWRQTDQSIAT
ncbi:hypothetical protein [Thalassotalea aquiviva]|uniref:hypothetical protein n=1 Tax=Thalassotalea aquiviva TaxID=3242415 RepID=UPI00352A8E0A